jgi:hypothetical protein
MKTAIVCPNKNDPAWKKLVAEIGEERSYIAFFRNGDVIPDAATARQVLKIKPEAGREPTMPTAPVETLKPAIQFLPARLQRLAAADPTRAHDYKLATKFKNKPQCLAECGGCSI